MPPFGPIRSSTGNRLLGAFVTAWAIVGTVTPGAAYTNPITGLRAGEYTDKVFNAGIEYRSGSFFRGVQQADGNVTANIEFAPKVPVLGLGVRVGGQAIIPFDERIGDIDEPKEVAIYGVVTSPLVPGVLDFEAGGTYFGFPQSGDGGVNPDSFEVMAGLVLGIPFMRTLLDANTTIRGDAFYDVRRQTVAAEANARIQKTIFDTVTVDVGAYFGYEYIGDRERAIDLDAQGVRQITFEGRFDPLDPDFTPDFERDRTYHGIRGDIFYDVLSNVRIGGGVRYDGISGADYTFEDRIDNSDVTYSGSVRVGF